MYALVAVLAVASMMAATAHAESVSGTTSDGALDVVVMPLPEGFIMEFINPLTGDLQEHVDYTVAVTRDDLYTFGPIQLTHTTPGRVTIPAPLDTGDQVLVSVFGILFIPIDEETLVLDIAPGGADPELPGWIKINAGWWASGDIDDDTFLTGIEYLVREGIIKVDATSGAESTGVVPGWIKLNAGWWAQDEISDVEFLNALEYLIRHGIITLES